MKNNNIKKAYTEILDLVGKYKDIVVYNFKELEFKAKCHLFGIELKEKYGLNVEPRDIQSLDYIRFSDYMAIGWWGEKYRRTISWSDDNKQPEDELLLVLGFPTGAYIFGDDYPTGLFNKFFQELKTYNPKYTDITNKDLYFSMENAGKIFNEFPTILKKYYEINKQDAKEREIVTLQEKLEKLTKGNNNKIIN